LLAVLETSASPVLVALAVIGFGLIASSASVASLTRRLIGFVDLVGSNDLADHIGLDLIGHNGPIGNIGLGFVGFISLIGFIGMPHCPHWSHHHMSLVGQFSLVSISGLIDRNGLVGFIGLGVASLVGFISLIGHIGLVGRIGHNGLVGVIGLSLGSLVGIVGLIGFGLVSLIGLDDLSVISLFGSSASSAHHLIIFFILIGLSIHRPFKQAALGVATLRSSATETAASSCYVTASSFHVHSLVRVKMWWWLALTRKKMWWWIASFGESYNGVSIELFNSSKEMTRRGWYAQQGLVSSSIANSVSGRCLSYTHTHLGVVDH
jgi:hypothetical protein